MKGDRIMNESKPEIQSKFGVLERSICDLESAAAKFDDMLDILEGTERPKKQAEKLISSSKPFKIVYDDAAPRINNACERLRSSIDRLCEIII